MKTDRNLYIASIAFVLSASLMGCGQPVVAEAQKSPADASKAQIAQIESNPNMPADQKAAAIARLQSRPVPPTTNTKKP